MRPEHPFHIFGVAHLVVILLTFFVPLGFAIAVRHRHRPALERAFEISLALLLAINFVGYAIYVKSAYGLRWTETLPMQLCDWATVVTIVALITRRRSWFDVAYFWGIAGTFQAILTPNLAYGFPDLRFISFFVTHSGIVAGVLFLMAAHRFRPHLNSIWRTLFWSEIYLLTTLVVDQLTGVNYGFLLHKPPITSLLSLLSDWRPFYILQLNALAVLFFALLYAPFAVVDLARRRSGDAINDQDQEMKSLRPS
jgi:hypothetical integral membrane protein (TIGR02206 family)